METKTIIYLVAAALILRVVVRMVIRFIKDTPLEEEAKEEEILNQ